MRLRPEPLRRDSPWILITLPEATRRPGNGGDNVDADDNALTLGLRRLATNSHKLHATSWPRPKMKLVKPRPGSEDDDDGRPRTATLEFPKVLDVALLGKVDMTRLSRHSLMQIANLCILPATAATAPTEAKRAKTRRCAPARRALRFVASDREASESEDARSQTSCAVRRAQPAARSPARARLSVSTDSDVAPAPPTPRTRRADAALGGVVRAQAPCTTCGRADLPERLHSHPPPPPATAPATSPGAGAVGAPREPVKSSVRKPVAMRYRARRRDDAGIGAVTPQLARTPEVGVGVAKRTVVRTPEPARVEAPKEVRRSPSDWKVEATREMRRSPMDGKVEAPREMRRSPMEGKVEAPREMRRSPMEGKAEAAKESRRSPGDGKARGPRTMMCYICGRGFGTASFPLHEPQCMQRWQRENAQLPTHLQRAPPRKPDAALTGDDWNRQAFEASQAQLVSCANCARTFNPDRLEVHQRSCRPGAKRVSYTTTTSPTESTSEAEPEGTDAGATGEPRSLQGPPVVHCYICGRMFGTRSIAIHEPQCLERWRAEDLLLPPSRRRPLPVKPASTKRAPAPAPAPPPAAPTPPPTSSPPRRRKPTMGCYLCGREFGTASINIHEVACLKRWRLENDKLPPARRRPEPEKPDIVFNAAGQIDFQGTMDAIWATHLGQLVPCKHCARTFNPDRVDVHERACKGPKT